MTTYVHDFATGGMDHVSCSPFRIPVARLEAALGARRRLT